MSKKVTFLALGAMLLAFDFPAEAQQPKKVPRIGLLVAASTAVAAPWIEAFRQSLRELGYIEGKNIILEIHGGEAKPNRITDLAAKLVGLKVDIIVAGGSPVVNAVKEATSTIPIVMRHSRDPVRAGIVASLAHPGGNITGLASISVDLSGKRLELLAETVAGVKRIAVLTWSQKVAAGESRVSKDLETLARALGVKLQVLLALDPATIDKAFLAMKTEHAQALIVMPSPHYLQNREHIIKHAAKNRLPAIYHQRIFVDNGGLMSYGADYLDEFRRLAIYVDKILKGAKPADLPVEQPTKFDLVINLKTAKAAGLKMPAHLLMEADRVIE
jgi:putative ABC transport system substrate-binding protein